MLSYQTHWNKLAEDLWRKRAPRSTFPDGPNWTLAMTPPLPEVWPISENTAFTIYVYCWGATLGSIGRFEIIQAPFGTIRYRLGAEENAQSSELAGGLEIGQQGLRPLTSDEILRGKTSIPELLAFSDASPAPRHERAEQLLDRYELWKNTNGVIANEVLAHHPTLHRALESRMQ